MSISGKWKKTVLGLILSGIVVISASSVAWAQTKTEAKNPFDNTGFVPTGKATVDDMEDQRNELEAAADAAERDFQKAKLTLFWEMMKAEGKTISDDARSILENNVDKFDSIINGDLSGFSSAVVNDLKTIWGIAARFGTNIFTIDTGFFKNDENDAQALLERAQKNYGSYPDVMEAAKDLAQKGIISNRAEQAYRTAIDEDALSGDVYYYTNPDGSKVYFKKEGQSFWSKGTQALGIGYNDEYVSVAGVTKGCIPLPAKIAENASCVFCPLFLTIFNAAQQMATNAYEKLAKPIANVMLIGFAIYIAFLVLKYVSAFTKQDAPKFTNEILQQAFKVMVAYILLLNSNAIYNYAVGPVLSAGMEFGGALLFEDGSGYMEWCSVEENLQEETQKQVALDKDKGKVEEGVLPAYLYVKLSCFIRSVQAEISTAQSIGSTLMCISRNTAAQPFQVAGVTLIENAIWDFSMFFQGLVIWILALIISLAFAFYLIDATVRLGIVGALMPFLIACWPFKKTAGYTSKGWQMLLNTFFTYAMMGLIVSVNIQLIMQGLTGSKGDMNDLMALIDGNDVGALQEMLDIGFSGFLVLLACCLFGWKLTGQATALAGTFASGAGAPIAPQIGGLAASGGKAAVLGTIGMGKAAADATGATAKIRQGWDNTKSFVGKALGFGKYSGKAAQQGATNSQQSGQRQGGAQPQQQQQQQNGDTQQNAGQQQDNNSGQQNDGNGQPQPKEPERTDANYNQDMARHNSSANAMGHENYERLLQQRSNDFENRNAAYARQIATSVAEEQRIKLEVTAQQQRLLNAKTATEQVRRDMVAAKGTPQEATAQQNYNTAMANLQAEQARFDALLKRQQDAEQKLIRQRAEQASVAQGAAKAKYDLRFYQKFVKPKA